jgi:hypothetical protein
MGTARGATKGYGTVKWSDYYQTGPYAAASGDQSIVTGPGQTAAGTPTAGAAPFAWVGLVMLLAALYIAIRLGAKLSTVG